MQHEPFSHKAIDAIQSTWPFVAGIITIMLATLKLWWADRKATKTRINDNAEAIIALRNIAATKSELHECRVDVRVEDDKNMEKITMSISELRDHSDQQHKEVMNHIINLTGKIK